MLNMFKISKIIKYIHQQSIQVYKRIYFKRIGLHYGKNFHIFGKVIIKGNPKNIWIGENCALNDYVFLEAGEKIYIGNNVTISSFVQIHTSGLDLSPEHFLQKHIRKPVYISNNVWIGCGTIILSGVNIANNVVIGANSTVTKNLEAGYLYAGSPAKKIRQLYNSV